MTDRLTDQLFIEKLYDVCGVDYYNDELILILKNVIKELYFSNQELTLRLRIEHIDRAILKYKDAKGKRRIWNTKQYFKACIKSAILETGLDHLEP
jgi:hypothetical protein